VSLTIRQLRDFVAVAEAGSFTRAAAELRTAQPALSYQIKRLEKQLGVRLFEREARGVSLTVEGRRLLEDARQTLHHHDELLARAASFQRGAGERLRVGFMAQGPGELLPEVLRSFKRTHPEVEISLHQFGFEDCFMGVTRHLTDVAFSMGTLDESDEVVFSELFEEPIVVAMAADHPLAHRERLTIEEVIHEPLFSDIHPPGRWRNYWDAVDHRDGSEPYTAARFATHDQWLEAMRLGGGISFCPESTPRYYPRPGLAFVPLDGMAPASHTVVWRKAETNPLVEEFVRTADAVAAQMHEALVG
jgi:DNA-binding transcriptional LysR family regulator